MESHLPKCICMSIVHHIKAAIHIHSDWFASCAVQIQVRDLIRVTPSLVLQTIQKWPYCGVCQHVLPIPVQCSPKWILVCIDTEEHTMCC